MWNYLDCVLPTQGIIATGCELGELDIYITSVKLASLCDLRNIEEFPSNERIFESPRMEYASVVDHIHFAVYRLEMDNALFPIPLNLNLLEGNCNFSKYT